MRPTGRRRGYVSTATFVLFDPSEYSTFIVLHYIMMLCQFISNSLPQVNNAKAKNGKNCNLLKVNLYSPTSGHAVPTFRLKKYYFNSSGEIAEIERPGM